jgi:type II secretory pathway component PulC
MLEGFQIDNIQPGGAIAGLGIKNGDIIIEANGLKLDSLDKVIRLYQQWPKLTELALTVLRNGRPVQIRYKFQ